MNKLCEKEQKVGQKWKSLIQRLVVRNDNKIVARRNPSTTIHEMMNIVNPQMFKYREDLALVFANRWSLAARNSCAWCMCIEKNTHVYTYILRGTVVPLN